MGNARAVRIAPAALAAVWLAAGAGAATIEGQVAFPGQAAPPMTAYVCDVETSRIRTVAVAPGQAKFSVEVPVGRYVVFLALRAPGAPDIYGAHTRYSLCVAHPAEGAPAAADPGCDDHRLADVTLATRSAHAQLNIDDWALTDDIAAQLDRIRGIEAGDAAEPLAAPHFSEYRVPVAETPAPPHIDAGDVALSPDDRARLHEAMAGGPNFAGTLTLLRSKCGNACERLMLVDWRSGRLVEAPGIGEIRGPLPCRADAAVVFRRDSRLVSITSARADGLVTQYYAWKPDSSTLAPVGEYPRSVAGFCAALPP